MGGKLPLGQDIDISQRLTHAVVINAHHYVLLVKAPALWCYISTLTFLILLLLSVHRGEQMQHHLLEPFHRLPSLRITLAVCEQPEHLDPGRH